MSTHYQTMRKSNPSTTLTATLAVASTLAVVLVAVIALATTHAFSHHAPGSRHARGRRGRRALGAGERSQRRPHHAGQAGTDPDTGQAVRGGQDPAARAGATQLLRRTDRRDRG